MCGDSTIQKDDVEKLMDGNKADMVFTIALIYLTQVKRRTRKQK